MAKESFLSKLLKKKEIAQQETAIDNKKEILESIFKINPHYMLNAYKSFPELEIVPIDNDLSRVLKDGIRKGDELKYKYGHIYTFKADQDLNKDIEQKTLKSILYTNLYLEKYNNPQVYPEFKIIPVDGNLSRVYEEGFRKGDKCEYKYGHLHTFKTDQNKEKCIQSIIKECLSQNPTFANFDVDKIKLFPVDTIIIDDHVIIVLAVFIHDFFHCCILLYLSFFNCIIALRDTFVNTFF
jgi:hypothetical protein